MADTIDTPEVEVTPLEQLRDAFRNVIQSALSVRYTSYSSQNRNPTGNAYQSVKLLGLTTNGFREFRGSVLSGLDLKGATVLDIGCNLGELSRLARSKGAAIVDGFEYDPFFVQIGQAINALNGITRVSLFQRDATDPSIYFEPYDFIFSFSVFTYVRKVLPQVAKMCRRMFVVETHNLAADWREQYIESVIPYFPHYCIVQRTDWGAGMKDGARLLIVYGHNNLEIIDYFGLRSVELGQDSDGLRFVNVRQSNAPFLRAFRRWYDPNASLGRDEFESAVRAEIAKLGPFSAAPDYRNGASGLAYWLAYLGGFFDYQRQGEVDEANIYIRYLRQAARELNFDPYMTTLVEGDAAALLSRVRLRFLDTEAAFNGRPITPITIFNPMPMSPVLDHMLIDEETGRSVGFSHQDGYHRHFSCLTAGVEKLGYRTIWYPEAPQFTALAAKAPSLRNELFKAVTDGLFLPVR